MLTPIFGGTNGSPSTSAVNYVPLAGAIAPTPTATETARFCVCPAAFTLQNFFVSLNTAPGAAASGKKYVFTVRKNQVDTAITLTILETATSASYVGAGVSFAAGDLITISMTPTGTPTAPTLMYWNLQADSGGTHFSLLMGGAEAVTNLSTSAVSYSPLTGVTNNAAGWSATEAQQEIICPCAGTISNLYVKTDTAPGAAKTYAIALVQNGSLTALSASVTGSGVTTSNDTTHSITVAAGDTLSIAATPTGTPTVGRYCWGFEFTPTNAGESFFGFGSSVAASTSSTQYEAPLGEGYNSYSTESVRQLMPGACLMTALYASLGTAPGGVTSRTLTLRRNAVSSPLAVTITGVATTGNSSGNVGLIQSDLLALEAKPTTSPAADTNGVHIGVKMFISTVTNANKGNFLALM